MSTPQPGPCFLSSTLFPGTILGWILLLFLFLLLSRSLWFIDTLQVYFQSLFFHLITRSSNSIFVLIYVSLSAKTFRSEVYVALDGKPAQEAAVWEVRGWALYFTTQPCRVTKPARVVAMHSGFLSAVFCTPILISLASADVKKNRLQTDPLVKGCCWCLSICFAVTDTHRTLQNSLYRRVKQASGRWRSVPQGMLVRFSSTDLECPAAALCGARFLFRKA